VDQLHGFTIAVQDKRRAQDVMSRSDGLQRLAPAVSVEGRLEPQRLLLPDGRGVPRTWSNAANEVITETLDAHFSKGASAGTSWLQYKITGLKRRISPQALLRKAVKAIGSG
jgi:hypothetical protein